MLIMLLPGVGVTYYGEEIGMIDANIAWDETVDPQGLNAGRDRYQEFSRDPERSPMQWNDKKNSGFSTGNTTWLPLAPGYDILNVENENVKRKSTYKIYKSLLEMRKEPAIRDGELSIRALTRDVIALTR